MVNHNYRPTAAKALARPLETLTVASIPIASV
jgi:hypothetical protein